MTHTLGKTKITQLALIPLDQNIGRLQIPMDNILVMQVLDPIHNLLQIIGSLRLTHLPLLLQQSVEIPIAQLRDDVHIVVGLVYVIELDDVFVGYLLHYVDLGVQVF